MTLDQLLEVIRQIVLVLGGAAVVIAGLSYFLGQVWAGRILERERAARQSDLERLRTELTAQLRQLEHELALQREKNLAVYQLKITLYQAAVQPIIPLLVDIGFGKLTITGITTFEQERLKTYSNLAMFAPSDVLDAYSTLTDYLLDCLEQKDQYDWKRVRAFGLDIFNKVRADIGLATDKVTYKGHR